MNLGLCRETRASLQPTGRPLMHREQTAWQNLAEPERPLLPPGHTEGCVAALIPGLSGPGTPTSGLGPSRVLWGVEQHPWPPPT